MTLVGTAQTAERSYNLLCRLCVVRASQRDAPTLQNFVLHPNEGCETKFFCLRFYGCVVLFL
jgi:hypothetical protein